MSMHHDQDRRFSYGDMPKRVKSLRTFFHMTEVKADRQSGHCSPYNYLHGMEICRQMNCTRSRLRNSPDIRIASSNLTGVIELTGLK